jgi:hypothetical protein
VAFPQQPAVRLRDSGNNNVAQAGVVVTAAIATGAGTLAGTLTATTNASGVATFTTLRIDGLIGDRTLGFSSGALTPATSNTVTVTPGLPAQLTMTTQPSATVQSGIPFPQQPAIQVRDLSGNAVAQAGVVVTAAIASGAGTLGGTLTATTTAAGLATFTDLRIDGVVGDRTLSFSSGALTPATSNTVAVSAGAASQLTITTQPTATVESGDPFPQQPAIQLRDSGGNAVPQGGVVITAAMFAFDGHITII